MARFRVNLNGTDAAELRDQNVEIVARVRELRQRLRMGRPHMRDYQTCDEPHTAYKMDNEEFVHWDSQLAEMEKWAEERAVAAQDQA